MVLNLRYKYFIPLLASAFFSIAAFATSAQDTIQAISQLQLNAAKAIEKQEYLNAVRLLNSANKLATHYNDQQIIQDVELGMAELYYHLQYFDKAGDLAQHAITFYEKEQRPIKLGTSYTLYANILCNQGNYDEASNNFKKADSIYQDLRDSENSINVLYGKGLLALARDDYFQAATLFKETIAIAKNLGSTYIEAGAYNNLADALSLINLKEYPESLIEARSALDSGSQLAEAHGYSKYLIERIRIRSQIYIAEKKVDLAEENLRHYLQLNDSIKQVQLQAIIEGIQAESAISDLNEIIAAQKDDLSKQEKSLFFGKLTGWLSISLILILSLLTLSLYKNNNLRAKANNLLKDKNTELQEAKENAEKASQAKAQFLSTITHELRTPMYTVTGLTHLLLEEDPKPEQREHLNSLKFSGEYLLSLINNILDLNKLEASKVELEKVPFNLKKRVDSVIISLKKSAEVKNNILTLEYDQSIPEEIIGDSLKISQILINLISNSIKFTENGQIWVRIKATERDPQQVFIQFEVEDTGDGISKKKQNVIFESFSQGSLQINRKYGGTGLGLSIVKNLLELMGSKINLESKLGEGSRFWFTLPYNYVESSESTADDAINDIEVILDEEIFKNKSILIVEDNKINQMITKKILEKKDMICTVVDNGVDAIRLTKEGNFDVILMDIHMPGISGIEATKKIREFNQTVPIIALTAVTIEENLEEFYRAGFSEFIPKPFKADDFFDKISRVLNNHVFLSP